jgi:hypothetical protein
MGSFDDSGNVRHDEGALVAERDDSQVGDESGEGVIRYFGSNRGNLGNQGRLAGIGVPDDAHIGHEFQFQADLAGFPGLTGFGMAGSLAGGGGKPGISPASHPAPGNDENLAFPGQISEYLSRFRIAHDSPPGHRKNKIRSTPPFLIFSFSVLAPFGVIMLAVTKIEEGGELAVGFQDHVPAPAPVAAVGTPAGNVLFTAKADATFSSIAGLDEDFHFIDKLDRSDSLSSNGLLGDRLTCGIMPESLPPGRDTR